MYRVADFVIDYFVKIGVKNFYTLPGGGAMHLIDALASNSKANPISFFHEQGASIAAEAAARSCDAGIGVCVVTSGPGATNAITAVAGAWIESIPLVIISGQVKTADMIGERRIRQGGVQEVSIVDLVKPVTKMAKTIEFLSDVKTILQAAVSAAKSGRPGPVWIDVPLDIQGASFEQNFEGIVLNLVKKVKPTKIQIDQVCEKIANARRPVMILGHGIKVADAAKDVQSLVAEIKIPTVATWNASDILHYNHPMNFGRPGVVAQRHANFIVQKSDLIVAIGASLDNITTAYSPKNFAPNAEKIIVNIDEDLLSETQIEPAYKIVSDAGMFISGLRDAIARKNMIKQNTKWGGWVDNCRQLKVRFENDFPVEVKNLEGKITHKDAVLALSECLPENLQITTGSSGLAIEAFYMMFRNKPGQKYFLTSGLGSMGYGLPSAIGVAVETKDKPVVLIESDGSLLMNIQELQTAANLNLKLCIVLLNNNGYASIRNTQRNYFNGRYLGTGSEADQHMPNIRKIATAYGLTVIDVHKENEIGKALQQFFNNPKLMLINLHIIENESLAPKCSAMPQKDGSIFSMPLEDLSPLLPFEELVEIMDGNISEKSKMVRGND